MIDDITIARRVPGMGDRPTQSMMPLDRVSGRPSTFGRPLGTGLFISYCPCTEIVSVRISVPKWTCNSAANYPLVPIEGYQALRPRDISALVARAMGVTASSVDDEADGFFAVGSAAVIRASYAVDLVVADPIASIRGCMSINRKNPARVHSEGHPTISTINWFSDSYGVKMYAKALELEHQGRRKPALKDFFGALAAQAKSTLRFEVSFRQARSLRRFWRIGDGRLPSLAVMCHPQTDKRVLTEEAERLRLYETYADLTRESYALRVRQIGSAIRSAQERLKLNPQATVGRRKTLTAEHVLDLAGAYLLLSAYNPREIANLFGISESKVGELLRELRELEIQPDSSPTGTYGVSVTEVAAKLRPFLQDGEVSPWWDESGFVDPPWPTTTLRDPDDVTAEGADGLTSDNSTSRSLDDNGLDYQSILAAV